MGGDDNQTHCLARQLIALVAPSCGRRPPPWIRTGTPRIVAPVLPLNRAEVHVAFRPNDARGAADVDSGDSSAPFRLVAQQAWQLSSGSPSGGVRIPSF